MDETTARIIMFALVPLVFLLVARLIAYLIKPYIPDGPTKDQLYRRS